jgi:hypothetical protein
MAYADIETQRAYMHAWRGANWARVQACRRAWYAANPGYSRAWHAV